MTKRLRTVEEFQDDPAERTARLGKYAARYQAICNLVPEVDLERNVEYTIFSEELDVPHGICPFPGCGRKREKNKRGRRLGHGKGHGGWSMARYCQAHNKQWQRNKMLKPIRAYQKKVTNGGS